MSRKDTLKSFPIIVDGDGSGDLTSAITSIQYLDNIGIQINLTTNGGLTMSGVFNVEVSADYNTPSGNAGNWVVLTSQIVAAGAPTPIYFDLNQLSAPYIRLSYAHSSGVGKVNAFVTGKVI